MEIAEGLTPLIGVVEISSEVGLVAAGVFVIVFVIVCAVAYWIVRKGTPGPQGTTAWQFNMTRQLPVSKPAFDRVAHLTAKAIAPPTISPEKRLMIENLAPVRNALAVFYRVTMVVSGLCVIGGSIVLFRQADSGNMLGLPAAIILLLGLGALLSGLNPNRTIDPVAPLDRELFKNIHVHVSNQPLTIDLNRFDLMKAGEMFRQGSSPSEVARAVYPHYNELSDTDKGVVEEALAQWLNRDV